MHLQQTHRPRESSFGKFAPPAKRLSIDTTIKTQRPQPASTTDSSAWYECASYGDIQDAIANGVAPARILYTNPTSSPASLRFAARLGVNTVGVDNVEDLLMIKMHNPQARLVFRINAGDLTSPTAALEFAVDMANDLLAEAASLKLQVVAVNFHVTSIDLAAFRRAIESSPQLVEIALEVERKLEAIGVSADLISDTSCASDQVFSPESPLAFPDFNDSQVAHNAFALVS